MKKALLFFLSALLLTSCSLMEYENPIVNNNESDWQSLYEDQKHKTSEDLKAVYKKITVETRTSETTEFSIREFCNYLINCPSTEIDSLYNIYCTKEIENIIDERFDYSLKLLEENTSSYEVTKLFDFIKTYSENGGCDIEFLKAQIEGVSPLIQDCMVRAAGSIDFIFGEMNQTRGGVEYCFHRMMIGLAGDMAESVIVDEITATLAPYPGIDVAATLIAAGYDTYTAIKAAYEFDLCCATHA